MIMSRIEEAVAAFEKLMSGSRKNMMEQMERNSKGELFILKYLYNKNTAVIPSEISDAMHTSTARISAALGALEKKGQIHREIDTTNRRNILVTITEAGRERSRSDLQQMRAFMINILTEMGEQEAVEFVRLLKRFSEITNRVLSNEPSDR